MALSKGYRSGLEDKVATQLQELGVNAKYEPFRFLYKPQREFKQYTPDFVLPNGIVIETKGYFLSADRTKHRDLKAMYPDLDVRFVFSNPNTKLSTSSRTTYASWCEHYGFAWASARVPLEWVQEPKSSPRLRAIEQAQKGVSNS